MPRTDNPVATTRDASAATTPQVTFQPPAVVSVDMGYGHLRAAQPLADLFGVPVLRADEPPLADAEERRLWRRVRYAHEGLSRLTHLPLGLGQIMRSTMDAITMIEPLYVNKDLTSPNLGVRAMDMLVEHGLGRGLVHHLRTTKSPLLTTFYAPAVIADRQGVDDVYCVATDADIHRIWAPLHAEATRMTYFAPSTRVVRRLQAYGVPASRIQLTGFPLPPELLGGRDLEALRRNLAARLVRLDPERAFRRAHAYELERVLGPLPKDQEGEPAVITFAVGGAGAQAEMADVFLPALRGAVLNGRLRIHLVAGIRREVEARFQEMLERHGLSSTLGRGVQILREDDFPSYYRRFNATLAQTDILWTKPSEMSFYAALGLALVLAKPLGTHERYNRRWLRERGAALKQQSLGFAHGWLDEWLHDGTLAGVAWSGFNRLPKLGTYLIEDALRGAHA